MEMQIEIPVDNDGYVLLQCSFCNELFKIFANDYEDDSILNLSCPSCALVSDNYFTDDIIELAVTMATNYGMDLIHNEMKKLEKRFKGGSVAFKAGRRPEKEHENPISAIIDTMVERRYLCCKKSAKIKPLLNITGSYCPFCGVKEFETEQS